MNSSGRPRWKRLVDGLTEEIRSGRWAPGAKLPSVTDQQVAGISQTTTMRAYRELVLAGLAVTVQGSGTYVADPLPDMKARLSLEDHERRIQQLEEQLAALLGDR